MIIFTIELIALTCRILGAPTMLAMALDKLALNPPAYLRIIVKHLV